MMRTRPIAWSTRLRGADLHVLPIEDGRPHEETRGCWCQPTCLRERYCDVIVHHSSDARELVEAHGIQ